MLFLVATPIGNLGDITHRALEVLRTVDLIACEDTRHSGHLLRHFEIQKPLVSYHEHNEARRTAELIEQLVAGKKIAVISDAGLPGISDPGHRLLRACQQRGVPYTILPGPSAVLTALIGSGFEAERFFYGGFFPVKSGGRERELRAAAERSETSVFFESPHRLIKTLTAAIPLLPTRQICVARELTKTFEEYRRGTPAELLTHYTTHPPKGEIVIVISGSDSVDSGEATERTLDSGEFTSCNPPIPRMHRFLLVFVLAILASCSDPREQAKIRLKGVDKQALRLDAARLYKQIYAAPGSDFLTIKQSQWPESFSAFKPVNISCHRDGFSIALTDDSIYETGLHIQPHGITTPPGAGSVKYERLEEGVYWYSFKK